MSNEHGPKKKRLHLDKTQCIEYSKSDAGLQALKSPLVLQKMERLPSPQKRSRLNSRPRPSAPTIPTGADDFPPTSSPLLQTRLNSSNLVFGTSAPGLGGNNAFRTASELFRSRTENSIRASDVDSVHLPRFKNLPNFTNFKGAAEVLLNQPAVHLEDSSTGNLLNFRKRALQFRDFLENHRRDICEPQLSLQFSRSTAYCASPIRNVGSTEGASNLCQSNSPKRRGVRKRKPKPQSNTLLNYYRVRGEVSTPTSLSPSGTDSTDSIPNQQSQVSHPPHVRKLFLDNDNQFDNFLDQFDAFMSQTTGPELNVSSQSSQGSSVVMLEELGKSRRIQEVNLVPDSRECVSQEMFDTSYGTSQVTPRNQEVELTYGLFGSNENDSPLTDEENGCRDSVNLSMLPTHVFEMILCRLPLVDLLLNYSRVAKEWNLVISDERFIPWKKRYHKLKTGVKEAVAEMLHFCTMGMNRLESCLLGLIYFMSGFNLVPPRDGIDCLRKHVKYRSAEEILRDKAPECLGNPCWPTVAALVILSETFWDVYNILKHLVSGSCPVVDALEVLYCTASFLLHFKRQYKAAYGLHYRVYYALYIFENQWTARVEDLTAVRENLSGQQNILKYGTGDSTVRLTHEQMRIVNHVLEPNHLVKIVAFAGSGKTSTLVEYATLRLGTRFLLVVYNKSVVEHAKKCFPTNVECRTSHSLAWGTVGVRFKNNLTLKLRPHDIMDHLQNAPANYGLKQQYARCVIVTMENFMSSADDFITTAHVPTEVRTHDEKIKRDLSDQERFGIRDDAVNIWRKMIDHRDNDVRAVHDCYLKLYQLSKPVLNYDCILIDEAQDCNPAILDVLLNQSCPKIMVGDPNQQIYAFRGAVDALDQVRATHVFYLTQSFRFGPEIAYVSSLALEVLKGKDGKTLVGGTQRSCVLGSNEGQVAILARSNVALFNEAVRLVCKSGPARNYDPEQVSGAFAGGLKGYGLDQLVDIYKLLENTGERIEDRFISRFKSFSALQAYAKYAEDQELLGRIQLVMQYTCRIPEYVGTIKSRCRTPLAMANVVFSTVHKAKGLEFDTVCLMDDFSIGQFPYNVFSSPGQQSEYNVLYVGITRAKKCLCMPTTLYFMLLGAQEKFEYPVSVLGERLQLKCIKCHTDFEPSASHVMVRRRLDLVGGSTISEGTLCLACSENGIFVPEVRHPDPEIFFRDQSLEDKAHRLFKWIVSKCT